MGAPSSVFIHRMGKELRDLERDPPPGIICYPVGDDMSLLEAYLDGPQGSPFEHGKFRLEIVMPRNYPFAPPQIRFKTPIYHPNIDDKGRICADVLKIGVGGAWRPSMSLATTLISLHTLMAVPNPEDPLDADIAKEFQFNHQLYHTKAVMQTKQYATKVDLEKKQGSRERHSPEWHLFIPRSHG
ncbi:ubiquitin-conjugating enzyme E2 T [Hesseltinella vesiculosa]|uniref:Ubiquitin-conjugating enzyme E2 T n=1 Tax=Hesseltinella vesiculosa TaxID=101127 RepID=A0A1X2G2K8_9FUNG|nr:ubiquitin-conjugating enzyme E2 T [Hesseltinella vesiculosa]